MFAMQTKQHMFKGGGNDNYVINSVLGYGLIPLSNKVSAGPLRFY